MNMAKKQELQPGKAKKDKIHIVYVLNHSSTCGGVKVILEHANYLEKLGNKVTLVCHHEAPTWFPLNAEYIQVPFEDKLGEAIPDCDVIVATYWDHIQECIEANKAPVVYFEQGDLHLFDRDTIKKDILKFIETQFILPKYIITVSVEAAKVIRKQYNREALVFHNSVDRRIFNPEGSKFCPNKPYIFMLGNDTAKFKGTNDIIEAFNIIKQRGYDLELIWVSSGRLSKEYNEVKEVYINPSQEFIGELYRGAEMYVSASHYESFSLPVLEAMSCGCPVITTNNVGVREYAKDRYNAIFAKFGNPQDLAEKIILLLSNKELKNSIIENGIKTAEDFNWESTITGLFNFYKDVSSYSIIRGGYSK